MSEKSSDQPLPEIPPRRHGYRLLRRVVLYHVVLGSLLLGFVTVFPEIIDHLQPLPKDSTIGKVAYRIAYIAFCIDKSSLDG